MTQRYPAPITPAMVAPAWVRDHVHVGGVIGDDVLTSTATLKDDRTVNNGPNASVDYSPRNQYQKATARGLTMAQDVTRRRGWIAPNQAYTAPPASPAGDPTITGISPATGTAGGADVITRITGTNFTPWTDVIVGGMLGAYRYARYISPTAIDVVMDCGRSKPGTATITVIDHGVLVSPPQNFTFS